MSKVPGRREVEIKKQPENVKASSFTELGENHKLSLSKFIPTLSITVLGTTQITAERKDAFISSQKHSF